MRFHQPSSRRIPDWQMGCIDSKWKWIIPWGVFGVVGIGLGSLGFTPWICETIERNISYEFNLRPAEHSTATSETMVVRVRSDFEIQIGEVTLDFSPPVAQTTNPWEQVNLRWRQELQRRHNVRDAVQRKFKKVPKSSIIVILVDPQVQLETIAIVWTSIEAVSKATLYFQVISKEQRGAD
jgi:hypothetical protein